jgi:hypothetical protein
MSIESMQQSTMWLVVDCRRLRAPFWWLLCVGLVLAATRDASANGKFPEAGQVVVDPSDPNHLVVRTTFGVLNTTDGGSNWDLICEGAMGYQDVEPPIAVTKDGHIVAGLFESATVSSEAGCGWSKATGPIEKLYVVDVTLRDPETAVGITFEAEQKRTRYWKRDPSTGSWDQLGSALPAGFIGLTVDVDPINPSRVYLSGIGDVAIGAMHPTQGGALFVRTAVSPGRLLYTDDTGLSWQDVYQGQGILRGLAVSPDGTQVLVGGEKDGVQRASLSSFNFTKVSDFVPMCLKWTDTGVYACGHIFLSHGVAVAHSTDGGDTFSPMLCMKDVRGPLQCPADSAVGQLCGEPWEELNKSLSKTPCGEPVGQGGAGGADGAQGGGPLHLRRRPRVEPRRARAAASSWPEPTPPSTARSCCSSSFWRASSAWAAGSDAPRRRAERLGSPRPRAASGASLPR